MTEMEMTNVRLDIFADYLQKTIANANSVEDNKYVEGYAIAMKYALETFTKLFEREVKTDD